jgi:hypothetical protein
MTVEPELPSPSSDQSEDTYDLYTRFGTGVAFVLKYQDRGVALGRDRIRWTVDGRPWEAAFADISAINLWTGAQSIETPMGATLCKIQFKHGDVLTILSSDASGSYDETRARRYRVCVEQLHQRFGP